MYHQTNKDKEQTKQDHTYGNCVVCGHQADCSTIVTFLVTDEDRNFVYDENGKIVRRLELVDVCNHCLQDLNLV